MKKILPLQSLRALCVIIVMIVHFHPYNGSFFDNSFLAGSAVITFLVLSGFIISKVYHNKILNINQLFEFIKKRFFRIYPLHFLFLIIFVIIEFLRFYIEIKYSISVNNKAFTINNLETFFSHFFLTNIFNKILTFNAPAWTVSGEFITSIYFGIVCVIFIQESKKIYFLLLSTFIFIILFFVYEKPLIIYNNLFALLSVIICFAVGFFCFKIYHSKKKIFFILLNKNFQIINFILLLLLIKFKILEFVIPICSGLIILFLSEIKGNTFFEKVFYNRFLIYTGKISYTLYLSHYLVFWIYTQIFRHILEIENLNSFNSTLFIENNFIFYLTKISLSLLTTYFVSHILYNKFEKKFIYSN